MKYDVEWTKGEGLTQSIGREHGFHAKDAAYRYAAQILSTWQAHSVRVIERKPKVQYRLCTDWVDEGTSAFHWEMNSPMFSVRETREVYQ